jgi:hypothetical protein
MGIALLMSAFDHGSVLRGFAEIVQGNGADALLRGQKV